MNSIHDWTARRSGEGITIDGRTADGSKIKLRYVRSIESDMPDPIATTMDGIRYLLSCQPCPAGRASDAESPAAKAA
ncbi:hypothetical protein GV829_04510 [Sphingomonas lacunae]|uniref:Uncharacterized protein n=1 Tax=Sphingomonas lacunae TaxID=2698828 RepID=A0A6M4ARX1_9SPHN|nr:hypothetical protein [Sphingomonas lacunae]QJQ31797.1 hypothetical protein GV829_04510 [Sphingomonas lacunae]